MRPSVLISILIASLVLFTFLPSPSQSLDFFSHFFEDETEETREEYQGKTEGHHQSESLKG